MVEDAKARVQDEEGDDALEWDLPDDGADDWMDESDSQEKGSKTPIPAEVLHTHEKTSRACFILDEL